MAAPCGFSIGTEKLYDGQPLTPLIFFWGANIINGRWEFPSLFP
jgi:hypothetical protein